MNNGFAECSRHPGHGPSCEKCRKERECEHGFWASCPDCKSEAKDEELRSLKEEYSDSIDMTRILTTKLMNAESRIEELNKETAKQSEQLAEKDVEIGKIRMNEKTCPVCECPIRKRLDSDCCWCGVAISDNLGNGGSR